MDVKYTESYDLPSRAFLDGYEDIPEEITIRAMKTGEEKMLVGSTSNQVFDKIIGKCIVEPENIEIGNLIISDKHFLMMKLRILTYGPDYHATYKCNNPNCRENHEYKLNLDDFPVYRLGEDFIEPFVIELPMSGDKLGLRLLRNKDINKINKRARRIKKKSKGMVGNIEYTLRMARHINEINGEDVSNDEAKRYVESMHGRDSAYMKDRIGKIEVGYDLMIYENCPYCGEEVEFRLPMTEEFFRPRFDD